MPVTFGSVGDIIAVGLLIKDLVTALNQSRGSRAEYKQLVDELKLLKDVLDHIFHICNTTGTNTAVRTFEVSALHDATLLIAQTCRKCIEGFGIRLKRYGKTLRSSGSRTKSEAFKAVAANIRWQLGEKEEVVRFRAEIASQTAALNLALVATTWGVGQDNQAILVEFEDVTRDQLQVQHQTLSKLSDAVTETNALVSKTNTLSSQTADDLTSHFTAQHGVLSKLSDNATETNALVSQASVLASRTNVLLFQVSGPILNGLIQIGDLCAQVKTTVSKIFFINVATYRMVLDLKASLPGYAERSLFSEPFVLEDDIGRICPVHLQCISSWEALSAVLEARFRGIQGHKWIQDGNWALQDHLTGREISRKRNWEGAFLPGQRVDMSMLFHSETDVKSPAQAPTSNQAACPRCQADVLGSRDAESRCDTCGLCFRRIVEIEETDPKPTPPAPERWLDIVSFEPKSGPKLPASKRKRVADEFDFSGFKRIHIVSRVSRVKRVRPVRPFQCDACIKTFRKLSHLRSHKRMHTDESNAVEGHGGDGTDQMGDLDGSLKLDNQFAYSRSDLGPPYGHPLTPNTPGVPTIYQPMSPEHTGSSSLSATVKISELPAALHV